MKKETKEARNAIIKAEKAKLTNEQIQRYKKLAVTRKDRMRYTQEYLGELFEKANEYVIEQAEKGKPLTIAGFLRKFDIHQNVWYRMRDGEMDHALYIFLAENDLPEDYADTIEKKIYEGVPLITYSEFVDGIYLRQQELLEEACLTKANPVGAIFLMKSMHRITDDSGVNVTKNTLNITVDRLGTLEELERADRLLHG